MFYGFAMANKSISVAVIDVVCVGSLINCVKSKDLKNLFQLFGFEAWFLRQIVTVEVPIDNNFFSLLQHSPSCCKSDPYNLGRAG